MCVCVTVTERVCKSLLEREREREREIVHGRVSLCFIRTLFDKGATIDDLRFLSIAMLLLLLAHQTG